VSVYQSDVKCARISHRGEVSAKFKQVPAGDISTFQTEYVQWTTLSCQVAIVLLVNSQRDHRGEDRKSTASGE
jgi:hypothetical protein